jgi:hypothetical protein
MLTLRLPFRRGRFLYIPDAEGFVMMIGALSARRLRRDARFNPKLDEFGVVGRRVVTDAGVAYMRDDFNAAAGGADITNFKFHDCGTGTGTEAAADTALGTPYGGARATGSQTTNGANVYRTVGTISFTSSLAITEHGLFSASSVGTLWDRTKFAAINVVNGDAIQFTYDLTITSGG